MPKSAFSPKKDQTITIRCSSEVKKTISSLMRKLSKKYNTRVSQSDVISVAILEYARRIK